MLRSQILKFDFNPWDRTLLNVEMSKTVRCPFIKMMRFPLDDLELSYLITYSSVDVFSTRT